MPFSFGWEGIIVILLVFLTGAADAPVSSPDASLTLRRAFETIEVASCCEEKDLNQNMFSTLGFNQRSWG